MNAKHASVKDRSTAPMINNVDWLDTKSAALSVIWRKRQKVDQSPTPTVAVWPRIPALQSSSSTKLRRRYRLCRRLRKTRSVQGIFHLVQLTLDTLEGQIGELPLSCLLCLLCLRLYGLRLRCRCLRCRCLRPFGSRRPRLGCLPSKCI
jgi:hypothetical protein